jgi:hypothetical protein
MKVVIAPWGKYEESVSDSVKEIVNKYANDRTNEEFVKLVEEDDCFDYYDLKVVKIPDDVKNWYIDEAFDREMIVYHQDGFKKFLH